VDEDVEVADRHFLNANNAKTANYHNFLFHEYSMLYLIM
jgi:hypothetical protein